MGHHASSEAELTYRRAWYRKAGLPENPEEHTYQACLDAIPTFPDIIRWIRDDLLDEAMCRLAVENNSTALVHVPVRWKTPELERVALARQDRFDRPPGEYLDDQQRLETIQRDALYGLRTIPHADQTQEMVELAILLEPEALRHANSDLVSAELADRALDKHPFNIRYVSESLLTQSLCLKAVNAENGVLPLVPRQFCDSAFYNAVLANALTLTKSAVQAFPEDFWTPDKSLTALGINVSSILHVTHRASTFTALSDDNLLGEYLDALERLHPRSLKWADDDALLSILKHMVRSLPVGRQYLDDWLLPTGTDGIMRLDALIAIANQLKIVIPDDLPRCHQLASRFVDRIDNMVKMAYIHQPTSTRPFDPSSPSDPDDESAFDASL